MKYYDQEKTAVIFNEQIIPRGHRLWFEYEIDKAEITETIEPWKTESELNSEFIQSYEIALDFHLDSKAKECGYDSIKTAVTYADEPTVQKFQEEGKAFRAWRSLCYDHAYKVLDNFKNELIEQPTQEEFIAGLPVLTVTYTNP